MTRVPLHFHFYSRRSHAMFVVRRENRYLLFLTENYAALDILKHYVMDSRQEFSSVERRPEDMEPFILFGSSFPKDKEYTQV